ncbi:polysaccharide biosynthesis tyrosine autokinase [Blastococcus sp. TF02A-30]|uniref:polysaccharide biosynthesis tyrosine autokinase n=1 Tax=Blastococcus sp. TF02A-30 TaxID=2250580 RepID=UPI0011BE9034|nr:polysaccharide biosynthesis tyrosine autokinase [Blastococcus sp. TF02A-30]
MWSTLRAGWRLSLAGLLLGGALGYGLGLLVGPQYTTHLQFFVSTTDSGSTSEAFQGSQLAQQRVESYAGLLTGRELADRVAAELDLEPEDIAGTIGATVRTGTVMIDVTVTDASPGRAVGIAEALVDTFPELVSDVENPGAPEDSPVTVANTDRPTAAVQPSPSTAVRNAFVGAVLGLVLGSAASIARVLLDRSVTDADASERAAEAPVIGLVFQDGALEKHQRLAEVEARTDEQYRQLRTNLQFLNVDQPPKVIMISSAVPAEGKTTTAVNLAVALADAGRRVTVVEADLRRPKVTEYLELVGGAGLTNVLAGTADLDDVLQQVGERDLHVLAAGPTPPNPSELLGSSQMAMLLEKLRADNDYVLVDAAPVLPVADSWGLAAHVDGVLLSVRYGSTRLDQLTETSGALRRVGADVLGVVLTMVPVKSELAAAHGHGYDYGYAPGRRPQADAPAPAPAVPPLPVPVPVLAPQADAPVGSAGRPPAAKVKQPNRGKR